MGIFPLIRRQAAEARGELRNASGLTSEQERFRQLTNEIGVRNAPYLLFPPALGATGAVGALAPQASAAALAGLRAAGRFVRPDKSLGVIPS